MNEFECNDAMADFLADFLVADDAYWRLRNANDPGAGPQLKKCAQLTVQLRKFLAKRRDQKNAEMIQNAQPTLF